MPSKPTDKSPTAAAADTSIQVRPVEGGYLVTGDVTRNHAGLKDFATWDDKQGGWYISKRRAYQYDHHYGLRLFSR